MGCVCWCPGLEGWLYFLFVLCPLTLMCVVGQSVKGAADIGCTAGFVMLTRSYWFHKGWFRLVEDSIPSIGVRFLCE